MYVFLKFNDVVKVVSNVTIGDDCEPVVDGELILESPREEESPVASWRTTVDAISWFKSLPMEAVYIDCGARDARWCPKSVTIQQNARPKPAFEPQVSVRLRRNPKKVFKVKLEEEEEEQPFMPESARCLFSDHPGVADFNPVIDELFEQAELLFGSWDELSERGEVNREVAKILHCYVFPAVIFQHEDIPVLQDSLRIITLKRESIEKEILDTQKNVDVTSKYLDKQKQLILDIEGMTTQVYLRSCNTEFVKTFYIHVAKDLQRKNMKLDTIQLKVNDQKKSGLDPDSLEKLVKARDHLHDKVQKLIIMREAIRNYLYRPFIPMKKKKKKGNMVVVINKREASLHSMFQGAHEQLTQLKEHLKRLCYRKLYTASVREAIESTLKMIQQEKGPTSMGDFSEFSIYLGKGEEVGQESEGRGKQWKSMQKQVDEWMADRNSALYAAHMEGCQMLKDLASSVLSDFCMASMGMEVQEAGGATDPDTVVLELKVQDSSGLDSRAEYAVPSVEGFGENLIEQRAPKVQAMRDRVLEHTWRMADMIVQSMKCPVSPGNRHQNRAWVCYGPYFWKEAGEAVERVYSHFHAPQARQVHGMVSSMPLDEVMDSSFCQEFLAYTSPRSSGEVDGDAGDRQRMPSVGSVSVASLDLLRCSISDLYARVNLDGANLKCQMVEMQSLGHSFTSLLSNSDSSNPGKDDPSKDSSSKDAPSHQAEASPMDMNGQRRDSLASDSGDSVHSDDLFGTEDEGQGDGSSDAGADVSPEMAPVTDLFEAVVRPYHAKVVEVLAAAGVMEKMRAVWKSVDFLCQKLGEMVKARGMDTLLPVSILATSSFPEDLFVHYYINLMILNDLKPDFAFHCMYDFSLTNAISTYMYLFEAKFPGATASSDESES